MKIKNRPAVKIQQGFSLIELMIAIPLSLLVLFAVLKIFTATIQSVSMQNSFSRVQENGRMAIELISRDIRGADYWGCANDIDAITNNLSDPSAVDLLLSNGGIDGQEDANLLSIDGKDVLGGSDTLTLRGAQSYSNVALQAPMAINSDTITLFTGSTIKPGDMILSTDCKAGDLFVNTGDTQNTNKLVSSVNLSKAYAIDAQILSPFSKTYFIAESQSGDGVYSLYRAVNGSASEMVRGINDLQIRYGEDSNASGAVDTYSDAASVSNMNNVLVIRVVMVSDSTNGVSGSALERSYTVSSAIRNRTRW